MKIVLTSKEHEAISNIKNMLGLRSGDVSDAVVLSVVKTYTETTIETNPDFTVDYAGLIMTVAPVLKGLYQQAIGIFKVIESLGTSLDSKWAKKEVNQ